MILELWPILLWLLGLFVFFTVFIIKNYHYLKDDKVVSKDLVVIQEPLETTSDDFFEVAIPSRKTQKSADPDIKLAFLVGKLNEQEIEDLEKSLKIELKLGAEKLAYFYDQINKEVPPYLESIKDDDSYAISSFYIFNDAKKEPGKKLITLLNELAIKKMDKDHAIKSFPNLQ